MITGHEQKAKIMTLYAPFSTEPDAFIWAGGFEDTFIPTPHPDSGRGLDEYQLTGHYEHWREDLTRAAEIGLRVLRYGIPWYKVMPEPDVFDWSWTDQVLDFAAGDLGLTLILDLMHYGVPRWLEGGFLHPEYPETVAAYARAVAERYGDRVRWYTPLNEPLITAEFCGLRGIWPPHLRGDSGFVRILTQICGGITATTDALRAVDPQFGIAHVEASARHVLGDGALEEDVQHWQARAWLAGDLLTGKVDAAHPLAGWLREHGCGPQMWENFARQPYTPDLWGVNYYPEISVHRLERRGDRLYSRSENAWTADLEAALTTSYARYGVPLFVSETSTHGDDDRRGAWLADSAASMATLHAHGVPVTAYTWWPLLDLVDWAYGAGEYLRADFIARLGYPPQEESEEAFAAFAQIMEWPELRSHPLGKYLRRMGIWRLEAEDLTEQLVRIETPVAAQLRALIAAGAPIAATTAYRP